MTIFLKFDIVIHRLKSKEVNIMEKKFEFADFEITSQEWESTPTSHAVVNPSSDNGRSFWTGNDSEDEKAEK